MAEVDLRSVHHGMHESFGDLFWETPLTNGVAFITEASNLARLSGNKVTPSTDGFSLAITRPDAFELRCQDIYRQQKNEAEVSFIEQLQGADGYESAEYGRRILYRPSNMPAPTEDEIAAAREHIVQTGSKWDVRKFDYALTREQEDTEALSERLRAVFVGGVILKQEVAEEVLGSLRKTDSIRNILSFARRLALREAEPRMITEALFDSWRS